MGLISRAVRVIRAKFNKVLSSAEDPIDQLEMTYQDMRDERRNMKRSIVNVKAQRKSLERKVETFRNEVEKHNRQAREAMKQGEEDLSRQALEQKKAKMNAIDDLEAQIEEIEGVEDDMYDKLEDIDSRINDLKTQKEILKAKYEGAEAMQDVNSHLSEGMGDYSVDENVEDIKSEITEMQSRAEAVQEFEDEREEQDVEKQLEDVTISSEVAQEMDTLRDELGVDEPKSQNDSIIEDALDENDERETEEEVA